MELRRMASSLHLNGGGINMSTRTAAPGHYLIASDFDQTLSFNDSGLVLSELIGVSNFPEKVAGLSDIHLVQQGAELAYLLRHDPEFRCVRREHLVEAGKQVRLKKDIKRFVECLEAGADEFRFSFYVISAAPRVVVQSALEGIVPPEHIYGAECEYDASSGEICAVTKVPAGYGKVAILETLATRLQVSPDRTVYVGDGSSDIHVMLHVNSANGFTIAVSEAKHITRIAQRTVISDNALSVLVPVLEEVVGWDAVRIRQLFASYGLVLQEWNKARTDWVTLRECPDASVVR
jgi:2-hydroxy-3-keto-5-methylthiopentenyl-1-phosphate phosphatase